MPVKHALATVRLFVTDAAPFRTRLKVWSRTYDDPVASRRSALVTGVRIVSTGSTLANMRVTDRYGVDHTAFWSLNGDGYTEYDTGGACGANNPSVFWGAYTGIYDARCLADPACDALRLQSFRQNDKQVALYNYLVGPVTFSFSGKPGPKVSVEITVNKIGGNLGNPAQRFNTVPMEQFVIQLP